MSVLPDSELLSRGSRLIDPFNPECVQPGSYDLALHHEIGVPTSTHLGQSVDLRRHNPKEFVTKEKIFSVGYELVPGACVLGSTIETVRCPDDCVARVEGKSSLGRLFLAVHVTAGFIDPGFQGQVTLEIANHGPWVVILWPGMPIAQINFAHLLSPCAKPYGSAGLGSHYQGQKGPTPAAGKRGT